MPSVAKILSLLVLATSLRVSLTSSPSYEYNYYPGSNLIFNEEAYKGRSHVYGLCPENYSSVNSTCKIIRVDGPNKTRECLFNVNMYYGVLKPGQVKVLLLGADKAIVSSFVPILRAYRWQVYVVDFDTCLIKRTRGLDKLEPVKFIVYENSFYALVRSITKGMPCYHEPNRSRDVQRCWIKFNELGSITGPKYWYKQSVDNENFVMTPLQEDTEVLEDFLMIDLLHHVNDDKHVFAEALIQGWGKGNSQLVPDQRRRLVSRDTTHKSIWLRSYTVFDLYSRWRWFNPCERIAYSTHAGYIGVCAKKEDMVLICSQYDHDGRLQFEHTLSVDRALVHFHEMAAMNLAGEKGGMLLVMAGCRDPMCRGSGRNEYRVARIGLDSDLLETVHTIPKLACDRYKHRASGKLFEDGPGRYCFTQVCYEDFFVAPYKDKNQKRTRTLKLDTHCFTDGDLVSRQVVQYESVDWSLRILSWLRGR